MAFVLSLAALLAPSPPARAATLVVDGGGFGHGVGMSQYGADGMAHAGIGYAAILQHYFTATALAPAPPGAQVRVLLEGNRHALSVSGASRVGTRRLSPNLTYTLTAAGRGRVVVRGAGRRALSVAAPARLSGPGLLRVGGRADNGVSGGRYRGALVVSAALQGGLDAVNVLSTEDYVRGVISGEMPAEWPAQALQAQAVASRSYGLAAHDAPHGAPFDVYADTRSQVYRGPAAETPSTDLATAATAGQVVTYGGRPVVTYFFDTSGGYTENVEYGFPGAAAQPWLRGVPDPYDAISPLHRWTVRLDFGAAGARLGGLVRGAFRGIEVIARGASPRIRSAYVLGSAGRTRVSGLELAQRLGLRDTLAYFTVLDARGRHPEPDLSATPVLPPAPASSPTGGVAPG